MKTWVKIFILALIMVFCRRSPQESTSKPVCDNYPHIYILDDFLFYRVVTESSQPEWLDDELDIWSLSDDFLTERDLQRCDSMKRVQ